MGSLTSQDPAVRELQRQVAEISSIVSSPTMVNQYLDKKSKDIINTVVGDSILDIAWTKYFYYSTFFESIDGYNNHNDGSGATICTSQFVTMNTGATANSVVYLQKSPLDQNVLRWDREARVRFGAGFSPTANGTIYLSVGDFHNLGDAANATHYGFLIHNNALFGSCSFGTAQSTVNLNTPVISQIFTLEARYLPGVRIDFFVDNLLKGSITTNLPTKEVATSVMPFFETYLTNGSDASSNGMAISWFEYIQKR